MTRVIHYRYRVHLDGNLELLEITRPGPWTTQTSTENDGISTSPDRMNGVDSDASAPTQASDEGLP